MVDPITVTLIALSITTGANLLLQLHQSIKTRVFHSECLGCASVSYESTHQEHALKDDK